MTSLSIAIAVGIGTLLALVLVYMMRGRGKAALPSDDQTAWNNAAVQKFFSEVAADEKIFGIERPEKAVDEARKAERLLRIETLLASSEYRALTEEQQEMQVKLLADDSVVRLVEEAKSISKQNERLILELRTRRQREADEFVQAQKQRDSDIARLREMERKAQADGFVNKELMAEIDGLKRRMAMTQYMGIKRDD